MDKITINVTQEDIDSGIPSNVEHCPVAKAITKIYPKADLVTVSHHEASVYFPETYWFKIFRKSKAKIIRLTLPKRVATFITNFDGFGPKDVHIKPFTFEAEVVEREQW